MATVVIGDNIGDDFAGTEDTYIYQASPTTNFGTDVRIYANKYGAADHGHSLLKFSGLSNVSGTVTDATLYIRWTAGNDVSQIIDFRRLLANWVEGESTWNIYSTGNNWPGSPGALTDGTDRSATISASLNVGALDQYYAFTHANLITDVNNFVNSVWSNYGWHIERNGSGGDSTWKAFDSSDAGDGDRPYLSVTYEAAGGLSIPVAMHQYKKLRET